MSVDLALYRVRIGFFNRFHSGIIMLGINTEKLQAITADVAKVYDFLAICETFLTENSKCKLEGYLPIFRKDRADVWGGVSIYA